MYNNYINKYDYRNLLKLSPGGEVIIEYINQSIFYINMVRLDNNRAILRLRSDGKVKYAVYLDRLTRNLVTKAVITLRKQAKKG